ncbi:hypothetical protein L6452_34816 [Arctium lappa]|uniref:Uncharacterized protein n=1 Tax=Arctium lappa TaxID=4217 RepID=A0ACB8YJU6_ARCLA|nr:hypothetical protein L6452_34816 [Arctium lappa]
MLDCSRKYPAKEMMLRRDLKKNEKTKSEFTKKIDLLVKERDNFASTIKVLEKSVSSSKIRNLSLHKGTHPRRRRYKDEELVWKKKPVEDELKERESCVHASNAMKNKASKGTYCQGGVEELWLLSKLA